jgi:hypothetical protein
LNTFKSLFSKNHNGLSIQGGTGGRKREISLPMKAQDLNVKSVFTVDLLSNKCRERECSSIENVAPNPW